MQIVKFIFTKKLNDIDSSIDKVLLQTNPGCTSRFLTSQTLLNFIW